MTLAQRHVPYKKLMRLDKLGVSAVEAHADRALWEVFMLSQPLLKRYW